MKKNKIFLFAGSLERIAIGGIVLLSILIVARVVFKLLFIPTSVLYEFSSDLPMMLYNALRFDLQTVAYILVVPTIFSFGLLWDNEEGRYARRLSKIGKVYFTIATLLLIIIEIVDIGFYKNFNSHINITFFDFFNEGPIGLICTIWNEYPVMKILVIFIGAIFIFWKLWKHVMNYDRTSKKWWFIPIYMLMLPCLMRGSLQDFPLRIEDTVVSPNKLLNDMTPNGTYMLKKAIKEKSKAFSFVKTDQILHEHGFKNLQEVLNIWSNNSVTLTADTLSSLEKALFAYAQKPITSKKPNILIIISESWGNHLIDLDSPGNDLLGSLRSHLHEDLLWRNFQSVRNNTIATMEMMTLATPFPRFFSSKYRFEQLPSSIAIPFNANGYCCEWISGMDPAWRNCNETLRAQGFTNVIGKYELLHEHPNYKYNRNGVFDEFLFNNILERLNKKQNNPIMMIAMTTTNHPPFVLPSNYVPHPISDKFYQNKCFLRTEKESILKDYIHAYQYYNNALGDFLAKFKNSKAAENTIVIVTGDHNVRFILDYNVVPLQRKYSVPLYIVLPKYLRDKNYPKHADVWGCHYDIVSTIAKFAFKEGTKYMKLGNDMLDSTAFHYSYNEEQVLATKKDMQLAKKKSKALEALLVIYFQTLVKL